MAAARRVRSRTMASRGIRARIRPSRSRAGRSAQFRARDRARFGADSARVYRSGRARSQRPPARDDHKTGKVRAEKNFVIGGGKTLQPVLYALAAERVLEEPIQSGRLYYCTAAGNYEERIVQIDEGARVAERDLAKIVGDALT